MKEKTIKVNWFGNSNYSHNDLLLIAYSNINPHINTQFRELHIFNSKFFCWRKLALWWNLIFVLLPLVYFYYKFSLNMHLGYNWPNLFATISPKRDVKLHLFLIHPNPYVCKDLFISLTDDGRQTSPKHCSDKLAKASHDKQNLFSSRCD